LGHILLTSASPSLSEGIGELSGRLSREVPRVESNFCLDYCFDSACRRLSRFASVAWLPRVRARKIVDRQMVPPLGSFPFPLPQAVRFPWPGRDGPPPGHRNGLWRKRDLDKGTICLKIIYYMEARCAANAGGVCSLFTPLQHTASKGQACTIDDESMIGPRDLECRI